MKYYAVGAINITDPAWVREYVERTTPLVARYGGHYLARTSNFRRMEGDQPLPQVVLLIEWSSREAATTFYDSDEYRPLGKRRRGGSTGDLLLVAGEDDAVRRDEQLRPGSEDD